MTNDLNDHIDTGELCLFLNKAEHFVEPTMEHAVNVLQIKYKTQKAKSIFPTPHKHP